MLTKGAIPTNRTEIIEIEIEAINKIQVGSTLRL